MRNGGKKRRNDIKCVKKKKQMEELNLDHHSPCFKYEERVCVKSLLDRKQESESSRRADSDHNEAAHQKMMSESWELNGERL